MMLFVNVKTSLLQAMLMWVKTYLMKLKKSLRVINKYGKVFVLLLVFLREVFFINPQRPVSIIKIHDV